MAKKKETSKKDSGKKKVEILVHNASGKYNLPYNKGQVAELDGKQADELIEAKDAKEVK